SSRRQIKLPGKYNDHIMGNSSQRDVVNGSNEMDRGVDVQEVGIGSQSQENLNEVMREECSSPELGKQKDKHEDMDKNGVDQENNIGVKKVMGNNKLNGARKDQYGKMDLNEKSVNSQVNSNANCSNNCVIIDNEGEKGIKVMGVIISQ
ncbi:hypothetical protein Tco_1475015, partial [Tanacetum coccineum]